MMIDCASLERFANAVSAQMSDLATNIGTRFASSIKVPSTSASSDIVLKHETDLLLK